MPDTGPLTLTVAQTAKALQVSENQVRKMIANGVLRTLPGFGRRKVISRRWLEEWAATAEEVA